MLPCLFPLLPSPPAPQSQAVLRNAPSPALAPREPAELSNPAKPSRGMLSVGFLSGAGSPNNHTSAEPARETTRARGQERASLSEQQRVGEAHRAQPGV